jgi:2-amino-4-hydroxy-6-hydroxymethyldihydropteridine diphosphokinase
MGYIKKAIVLLNEAAGVAVKRVSSIYETVPEGGPQGQENYYNLVVEIDTILEPKSLFDVLKEIELKAGRQFSSQRWAQREIDLDILLFEDRIVDEVGLQIPHPRLRKRIFVLKPLSDLAPEMKHPGTGLDVMAMLRALENKDPWRKIDEKIVS